MASMSDAAENNLIKWINPDFFVIWDTLGSGNPEGQVLVHHEQVHSYFQYDKALQWRDRDPLDVPAGYLQFQDAYNNNTTMRSWFACYEPGDNAHTVITGLAPTKKEVLGVDVDLQSKEEREGGQILNGAETETLNSMLWDAAEQLKCQCEHFQQGYQDHCGHWEDDCHAKGPLGGCPSSLPMEARHTGKLSSSKCREATRVGSFHRNNQMPTHLCSPAPIASSSTITLDAISHYSIFPDHTGMPDHDPSNVTVNLVGMDISIKGLEEEYREEYDGIADAEGKDDMMEQGRDAENSREELFTNRCSSTTPSKINHEW
ncbi:hypothetical protein M404DRAFT_998563 [Pisolithus tinctorius Marx 270]|uniref:Uncharacterized protein n=1 Tax=Pisolithus tinctorius Marx 270 TaxID=870435 RepID=A0A0C3KBZ0_PISTI|nr:hypothetical protein M404DRAFT_998563 [Pisolithus tinctorius Marx 270]